LGVALTIFSRVPWIGDWLVRFIQGGPEIGEATLSRLFAAHVIIIPLLLLGLFAHHLYLVIVHGITPPAERRGAEIQSVPHQKAVYERDAQSKKHGEWFHPTTAAKSGLFGWVVLLIVGTLAVMVGPPALHSEAG